jgi:hypothetical protein
MLKMTDEYQMKYETNYEEKICKNTKCEKYDSLMNNIQSRPEGVPGMALIYGELGLAKRKLYYGGHCRMMRFLSEVQTLCPAGGFLKRFQKNSGKCRITNTQTYLSK